MKNEKGITLTSLMIYIILMTFVVAGISAITASFYNNMNEMDKNSESAVSFAKFNMYFLNDIKSENARIVGATDTSVEIAQRGTNGMTQVVTYSIQEGTLYRDKVKICDKVKGCKIEADKSSGVVTIYLNIDNYEKSTTYQVEPKTKEDNRPTI